MDGAAYSRFLTVPRHGRRVARRSDGTVLLLHDDVPGDGGTRLLAVGTGDRADEKLDPDDGVRLLGSAGGLDAGADAPLAAIVVDAEDTLHLAWTAAGTIRHASVSLRARDWRRRLADPARWRRRAPISAGRGRATLGDVALHPDGTPLAAYLVRAAAARGGPDRIRLAAYRDGRWSRVTVAEGTGLLTPTLDVGRAGTIHLTWTDWLERLSYASVAAPGTPGDGGGPVEPVRVPGAARVPSIACADDGPVIAYQTGEGRIEYAAIEDGRWRSHRLSLEDARFQSNYLHSPQLGVDRHGVVWLVFADNTRRQTFVARWLGRGWSQILDGPALFHRSPDFDANRVPADRLALEKRPPPAAADLGVALASDAVATARELHRIAVPAPAAADGGYVLFLDMLEVGAWSGLRQVLEPAAKAPENPVFPVAREEDAFDRARTTGHGTVLRDGERFRMWYTGISTDREMPWWQNIWIGYAESEDGRRWRRVSTGNVAPSGKRGDNVLLFPIPSRWHPPDVARPRGGPIVAPGIPNMAAVLKDERDPNPARRYKLVWVAHALRTRLMAEHGHFELDAPYLPAWLFSSPDGLDWRAEAAIVDFRAGRPWTFAFCSVYEDERAADPATRYRAAGFFTPGARRRTGGVASSPDLVHWTGHPRNPAFEPLARGIPVMPAGPPQQIHDTVVFPYRGLHLALYQYQYDTRHLHDIELAVSRDGERFQLVRPGDKVIPKGPPGAWDANYILPSAPVVVGDEIYLYYCGGGPPPDFPAGQHCDEGDAIGQGGLAVLRRDGFVHVTPTSAAGGVLETIPLAASGAPWRLVVNARCSTAAAIAVEVLDAATGRPVPGLERETCHPLRDDVVRQGVSWSGRSVVALPAGVGRVRLRFYLDGGPGEPRLYGFGFESADQEVCHDRDTG